MVNSNCEFSQEICFLYTVPALLFSHSHISIANDTKSISFSTSSSRASSLKQAGRTSSLKMVAMICKLHPQKRIEMEGYGQELQPREDEHQAAGLVSNDKRKEIEKEKGRKVGRDGGGKGGRKGGRKEGIREGGSRVTCNWSRAKCTKSASSSSHRFIVWRSAHHHKIRDCKKISTKVHVGTKQDSNSHLKVIGKVRVPQPAVMAPYHIRKHGAIEHPHCGRQLRPAPPLLPCSLPRPRSHTPTSSP